ncbi:CTP synthase [Candidatus Bathyarchaeota archaeon]|nr:CTP synthase [Candidatus Bathyarchaeota archaeon]
MVKYIFITGGVLSGIGKGIITCSIGKMLQARGFEITAIKCDPYLNVDAGTMNPYIHGEVFVLDDGYEADMDLGTYERFLGITLTKNNNITSGQIYLNVIKQERNGGYLGRCVQIIPHITDEIKRKIRITTKESGADIILIECGGTVGDIESLPFLEAFRQIRMEEKRNDTLLVHVTLVPVLNAVGEPKTKPTQHSVKELRAIGLQPDIIVARLETGPLPQSPKEKIASYCSVEDRAVFTSYNIDTIYKLPLILENQGMGDVLTDYLKLESNQPKWSDWEKMVNKFETPKDCVKIALCGKYTDLADSYVSVNEALKHAAAAVGCKVKIELIETELFEEDNPKVELLKKYDGVIVPGGFGSRGTLGKIKAIEYCRTNNKPFLGICYGLQLSIVEIARNLLKLEDADSTECNPKTKHPVIDLLPEQKELTEKGGTMRLGSHEAVVEKNSLTYNLYKSEKIYERHRHRWEINLEYKEKLESVGVVFGAWSFDKKRAETIELPNNKFFFATQSHPEFKSRPWNPSPPYYGFIKASFKK